MNDPLPENIQGEKVQRHVFKHEINWGYVALAVAVVATAYLALRQTGEKNQEDALSNGGVASE